MSADQPHNRVYWLAEPDVLFKPSRDVPASTASFGTGRDGHTLLHLDRIMIAPLIPPVIEEYERMLAALRQWSVENKRNEIDRIEFVAVLQSLGYQEIKSPLSLIENEEPPLVHDAQAVFVACDALPSEVMHLPAYIKLHWFWTGHKLHKHPSLLQTSKTGKTYVELYYDRTDEDWFPAIVRRDKDGTPEIVKWNPADIDALIRTGDFLKLEDDPVKPPGTEA